MTIYQQLQIYIDPMITLTITVSQSSFLYTPVYRSSHRRCSMKKDVLENFAKFTGKHLCQGHLFNKVVGF